MNRQHDTSPMRTWLIALLLLLAGSLAGCTGGEELQATSDPEPTGGPEETDADANDSDSGDEASRPDDAEDDDPEEETSEESSEDEDSEDETSQENDTAEDSQTQRSSPAVESQWFNGSVQGSGTPVGFLCLASCDNQFSLEVTEDARAIVAEMRWEADATMRFDVDVPEDACERDSGGDCQPPATSGEGGYLDVRVLDEAEVVAGNWSASAWADDSLAQPVDFTIVVSQFGDGQVPEDFTRMDRG